MEPYAREAFEDLTGMKIEEVGFCAWNHGKVSASPDGRIDGQNVGWEVKAPDPDTHAKYLFDGVLPEEYAPQVHGSMAVTGADSWWFMSYCPRIKFRILGDTGWFTRLTNFLLRRADREGFEFEILKGGPPPLIIEVKRDELTERYLEGLHAFQRDLEEADRRMAEIYSKPAFRKGGCQ